MLDQPLLPEGLFASIRKALVWTIRAMHKHPQYVRAPPTQSLNNNHGAVADYDDQMSGSDKHNREVLADASDECDDERRSENGMECSDEDEEDAEDAEDEEEEYNPEDEAGAAAGNSGDTSLSVGSQWGSSWAMTRLRGSAWTPAASAREHVLSIFAALCDEDTFTALEAKSNKTANQSGNFEVREMESVVVAHRHHLLETALRANLVSIGPDEDSIRRTHELAETLLGVLERVLGSVAYIELYSQVQRRVEGSKHAQRKKRASEAISDPSLFARRKVDKQLAKKNSRKRKKEKKSTRGDKRLRVSSLAYTFDN